MFLLNNVLISKNITRPLVICPIFHIYRQTSHFARIVRLLNIVLVVPQPTLLYPKSLRWYSQIAARLNKIWLYWGGGALEFYEYYKCYIREHANNKGIMHEVTVKAWAAAEGYNGRWHIMMSKIVTEVYIYLRFFYSTQILLKSGSY